MVEALATDQLKQFLIHCHTERSNFRLKDSTNKVSAVIDYAVELGMTGVAISDHEVLSAHVEAIKYVKEGKEEGKIPEDFTLGLANEIYLVDREVMDQARENNEPTRFYHFLLCAKDAKGYRGLRELSSKAWKNGFWYRGLERVPTYYDDLQEIMKEYKGHIIASSACIGSEFARTVIDYVQTKDLAHKKKIHRLVTWYKELFGDLFHIEIQPSYQEEQIIYNKMALTIAKAYGIKAIVATDAHYINKDQAKIHEIYLKADEGEREVASFYSSTYMMSIEEMWEFFKGYMDPKDFHELLDNTVNISNMVEDIDLFHEVIIPKVEIPEFELKHTFKQYYDKYEYLKKFAYSHRIEDQYHLKLIEDGMKYLNQEVNETNLARIDVEYKELWHISEKLGQPVSSYYLLVKEVVDLMWQLSLVGVSRGSAASWYTVYLLGITQINPIDYDLPHWRHLSAERPELPDIDIDTESAQRAAIIEKLKEKYGEINVLNISTMNTEGTRSSILTVCRGMGIDKDIAQNIANLIPVDKTGMWSVEECLHGDEDLGKKPVKEFIAELDKYPGLLDGIQVVEGLVAGRSQHASGLYIFNDGYNSQNAMMKTTSGLAVTQFNMGDSDYQGGLKLDALTITGLDRIRSCMELLLKEGKIEWQGTLRATYDKYLHPDVINFTEPGMFKLLQEGEVIDAFQFDSAVGSQAIQKIKPQTFKEIAAGNSLMRLSPDGGESPLDRYVRHKNNIDQWYDEMRHKGLTEDEIDIMKEHLSDLYGVADTQEIMMLMSMDERISAFTLTDANKLRKGVAKKSLKVIAECEELFYNNRQITGASKALLDYVWNSCFKPMFGYSFSLPHIAGYTVILMQELNLAYYYGVIYWKTACLTVNSGLFGEKEGTSNYGAIAKAVGDMKGTVLNPDINLSDAGFKPLESEHKILFGLKPIVGLGKDAVKVIMEHRPFADFDDFYDRMIHQTPTLITEKKAIVLIKAGCFDNLYEGTRRELMIEFTNRVIEPKQKLTMTQLPQVLDKVPANFIKEVSLFKFKTNMFGRNKIKPTKQMEKYFLENLSKDVVYDFDRGSLRVDEKTFKKEYDKRIEPLKEWLKSQEAVNYFNSKKKREFWIENCMGTVEQWEMDTVVFYSNKHELDYAPLEKYFSVSMFSDIEPDKIEKYGVTKRNRIRYPIFQLNLIAGTVVDKNKDKGFVYLSTQDGVVAVKYTKGTFSHYDKKIVDIKDGEKTVLDESWFKRGTRLVVVGRRRGDEFIPKKYAHTPYRHTTMKISKYDNNDMIIQHEKVRI